MAARIEEADSGELGKIPRCGDLGNFELFLHFSVGDGYVWRLHEGEDCFLTVV